MILKLGQNIEFIFIWNKKVVKILMEHKLNLSDNQNKLLNSF